jgi:phosphoglycolate phosphatase-like HAD superfamily hydrolase
VPAVRDRFVPVLTYPGGARTLWWQMRYRCLIVDHDDTAVDSTARIHYPAHRRAMEVLRPGQAPIDLEGWLLKNFEPGLMAYLKDELGFSEAELEVEYRIWRDFNLRTRAPFFPGFLELLRAFRDRGGRVAVVSHSEAQLILEDYGKAEPGGAALPELVFGWDPSEQRRKPSPWPVQEILRRFSLQASEVLVVDDLKPGLLMAKAAGVDVAGAGWSHRIEAIQRYMKESCKAFFATVPEFAEFVLTP